MAAGRKLLAEVEKVLKKIDEGIEEFNEVWDNVHNATHANQRDKFEAELKTQIKKLQRDRDQLKTWQSDKSIKDKNPLGEARKKIEVEMERFKEFERDAKTKTFSKEGLSKSDKMDPHEQERRQHRQWMQDANDKLNVQIDEIEAELEAHAATPSSKKGKKDKVEKKVEDDPATIHTRHVQETHRWHVTKLEQLLRRLDNSDIAMKDLDELKESVDYYVDDNSRLEDEFLTFDNIYDAFSLEEVEDYLTKDKDRADSIVEAEKEAAAEAEKEEAAAKKEEAKEPAKATNKKGEAKAAGATSPSLRAQKSSKEECEEPPREKTPASQPVKPWPPMVSVWQNLPPALPKEPPPPSKTAPPPPPVLATNQPPPGAPRPTLPPPMQPAPERPPPPSLSPMLNNSPPNQPPPKPAPHAAPPHQAPPFQMPQGQPPTQAPPQVPLPSPPSGSPPRPQPGSLGGLVGIAPMPPPPSMAPPAPMSGSVPLGLPPQGGPPGSAPPPPPAATGLSEPPTGAPPPPPPPLRPPPPPSAPTASAPPAVLTPAHAKKPPSALATDQETASWSAAVAYDAQQAPPPPSEAPPPPSEPIGAGLGRKSPPHLEGNTGGLGSLGGFGMPLAESSSSALHGAGGSYGSGEPSPLEKTLGSILGDMGDMGGDSRGLIVGNLQPLGSPGSRSAGAVGSAAPEASIPLSSSKLHASNSLDASYHNLPLPSDCRRNRKYLPRNPYVHMDTRNNAAYPTQPTRTYDDPAMFEKYDLDALFFIFYYQQGTYQQHLAAKELKKLSWRYHTKYLTWFQRHEEPRLTASDYERGAYVYFDHDSGWCQRIKSDFTFEYQFLEDESL